ncbi:hypothetical protein C7999DRAFT_15558 [Corynascus novoguineensis]|uniref:Uncharacterized protein n=1 Tax=Corynascus novoguineensis TaxID=1126955 RepID=A0AAN7CS78_9PEZI|nr:hypothetical protein C7999DRAFT_15558 [Corynascus novoguineensis]
MPTTILRSRALATLPSLRHTSHRLSPSVLPVKHVRFVNTEKDELGGVQGSEPPGPQPNRVNWKAGTITAVGVMLAGWWMLKSKSKQGSS